MSCPSCGREGEVGFERPCARCGALLLADAPPRSTQEVPTPPRELPHPLEGPPGKKQPPHLPPPPRRVPLGLGQLYLQPLRLSLLIISVSLPIMLIGMGVGFGPGLYGEAMLSLAAEPEAGWVLATVPVTSYTVNKRRPTEIRVEYLRGGERVQSSLVTVDSSLSQRAKPGATVDLEVARYAPHIVRPVGGSYSLLGYYAVLFFLAPVAGFAVAFSLLGGRYRNLKGLLTRGRGAIARVVGRSRVTGKNGGYVVSWEYRVEDNAYRGVLRVATQAQREALVPGSELTIVYDPSQPTRSCYYAGEVLPLG